MTLKEAHMHLSRRLRFADPQQLSAIKFLQEVDEACERVAHCKQCWGEGVNRRGELCRYCAEEYPADVLLALGIADEEAPVSEAD